MNFYQKISRKNKKKKYYVNLWKKIKNNSVAQSVFQSEEQNKKTLGIIENYVKGSAFKQIIEDRTKKAVNEYAKEKDFKQIVNDVIKDTEERLRDKIDDSKLKTVETLGIFVALFTFVSIDYQVFKSYKNPLTIGGLIFILLGSLTMFVILIDYLIINSDKNNKIKKRIQAELWLVNILFLVIGFFLFIISKK